MGDSTGKFGRRAYDPEKRLERTLKTLGLVGAREQSRKGLHFVLADTATQLWTLLLGFIGGGGSERSSAKRAKEAPPAAELADQLDVLCQLVTAQGGNSAMGVGASCSANDASPVHRKRPRRELSKPAKRAIKFAMAVGLICKEVSSASVVRLVVCFLGLLMCGASR